MSNLNQPKKLKAQSIEERLRLMGENFDDYEPVTIKYPNTLLSKDLKKLIVLDNIKTFYDSIISRIDYSKDKLEKVIFGDSVTEIGEGAFCDCTALQEIVIPNSVTKIGDDAFRDCTSLYEIDIPNSVTEIGNRAFYGCKSLEEIVIPNSVTEIGDDAFYKCMLLDEVIIPDSVTYIGPGAFKACTFLRRIVLPKSLAVDETDIIDDVTCVAVRKIRFMTMRNELIFNNNKCRKCLNSCVILMGYPVRYGRSKFMIFLCSLVKPCV